MNNTLNQSFQCNHWRVCCIIFTLGRLHLIQYVKEMNILALTFLFNLEGLLLNALNKAFMQQVAVGVHSTVLMESLCNCI